MKSQKTIWAIGLFILGVVIMAITKNRGKNTRYVAFDSSGGKRVKVKVGSRLSTLDRATDAAICRAVKNATKSHIESGRPVSRYDVKRKAVYLEYPDGKIEYKAMS